MSGMAAAVALRNTRIAANVASALAESVRYRARNGLSIWSDALCCLVQASAESGRDEPADGLRIAGDIRLDNREDLIAALDLQRHRSDAELVLAAYRTWGPECCAHLAGDFAFALWDPAARTLLCARDQFGVKPLFYGTMPDRVVIASEMSAVVPAAASINELRVAGYLLGLADEPEATAFAGVHRLPPGHRLTVTNGSLTVGRYWQLEPESGAPGTSAEIEFRRRFADAVEVRLRGPLRVGAMLSGGLDSSAIAAVAATRRRAEGEAPLPVYSFHYPSTPAFDERRYVDAMIARHHLDPVFVDLDDLHPADGLDGIAQGHGDLSFAPGVLKIERVYRAARQHGTRVILDGHGGDEVVSHGYGRLGELARSRRWRTLYRELRGVGPMFGESAVILFLQFFAGAGVLGQLGRRLKGPAMPPAGALLNPDFARTMAADDRYRSWAGRYREASRTEAAFHRWTLTSPAIAEGFEALDRIAARAGVELRFPFFDQRLVRYAIALPSEEKLRDGWSRSILRRAMEGILPPEVQWRRDKVDFTAELSGGLARHHRDLLAEAAADGAGIGRYVDLTRLRRLVGDLVERPGTVRGFDLFAIWRSLFLMLWLKSEGAR